MVETLSVNAIRDLAALRALEGDWRAIHRADPQATVFTSWPWMWGRLVALAEPWWVLAARAAPEGPIVALLPLRLASPESATGGWTLSMAGSPLADYTGFVCSPGFDPSALAAFATYLRERLSWRRLEVRDVADPRLERFLAGFPEEGFRRATQAPTPCPYVELEPTWEAFLRRRVRSRRRQTLRRQLRAIDRLPGVRTTTVGEAGEAQIATLLALWQGRWGEQPEARLAAYRSVFRACLAEGRLWLDVLWDGEVPIAGLLAFLDPPRSRFCFYISGYDPRYAEWSPGIVIVAHSIRAAIRDGYRVYDFLRGDEAYKRSFGARCAHTENVTLIRRQDS